MYLAGFDGFTEKVLDDYYDKNLINTVEPKEAALKNKALKNQLSKFASLINVEYITISLYVNKKTPYC